MNNRFISPAIFHISTRDWWVKPIGMLVHNWALIEESSPGTVTVYFFHDKGSTRGGGEQANPYRLSEIQGLVAVVDSLDFQSQADAIARLDGNGFRRLAEYPGPWQGIEPVGDFYDARPYESGIYSKGGYWQ
jgi:hypothetical protein